MNKGTEPQIQPTNGAGNGASSSSNDHLNDHPNIASNGRTKTMPVPLRGKDPKWKYNGAKEKPTRKEVDQTMGALTNLLHASNKPLPNRYGDGKQRKSIYDESYEGAWADIKSLMKQGHLKESYNTISTVTKHKKHGGYTDDKTYIVGFCNCISIGVNSLITFLVDGKCHPAFITPSGKLHDPS